MKNKIIKDKGFTLVELLAAIVIIAIITLLAVSGFGSITKKTKEQAYNNLVKLIETKAAEYTSNTGVLITNVDNLVKLGYVEADNENGEVISPKDGSVLNCHLVSIIKEGDNNFYGQYSEEEECDVEKIKTTNLNLGINEYTTIDRKTKLNKIEPSGSWTNKDVILEAVVGEKINIADIKKIKWTSENFGPFGAVEKEINGDFNNQKEHLVTAEQIINTAYTLTVYLEGNTTYSSQEYVRIDKVRPKITKKYIENEDEWTNADKKITILATDGNGSGIYGYYVGPEQDCNAVKYTENPQELFETAKENGTYYVCVKDKAGNVSEDKSTEIIEIKKVDKTPPSCGPIIGESTSWARTRTISVECIDGESGCRSPRASQSYNTNTRTANFSVTISDNVGNRTVCSKNNANIYVDTCSQLEKKIYGDWSICNKSCGGGKRERSWQQKSSFSGIVCDSGMQKESCNMQQCESNNNSGNNGGNSDDEKNCSIPNGPCHYEPLPPDQWYCESYEYVC